MMGDTNESCVTLFSKMKDHIKENNSSNFSTRLATPILLNSDYQCALCELHLPASFKNITRTNNSFMIKYKKIQFFNSIMEEPIRKAFPSESITHIKQNNFELKIGNGVKMKFNN